MVRGRIAGAPTPDMYRKTRGRRLQAGCGAVRLGPQPQTYGVAVRSSHPYEPALQFRGYVAGAPTPDMYGRSAFPRPLRARSTGYAPALQVRGRVAGAPTPDI
eukprot:gene9200-biopygen18190